MVSTVKRNFFQHLHCRRDHLALPSSPPSCRSGFIYTMQLGINHPSIGCLSFSLGRNQLPANEPDVLQGFSYPLSSRSAVRGPQPDGHGLSAHGPVSLLYAAPLGAVFMSVNCGPGQYGSTAMRQRILTRCRSFIRPILLASPMPMPLLIICSKQAN